MDNRLTLDDVAEDVITLDGRIAELKREIDQLKADIDRLFNRHNMERVCSEKS